MERHGLTLDAFCAEIKAKVAARETPQSYDKDRGEYVDGHEREDHATQMKALQLWAQVGGYVLKVDADADQSKPLRAIVDTGFNREPGPWADQAVKTITLEFDKPKGGNGAAH